MQHWKDIDIGRLPMAVINRWKEHPEEMTTNEMAALQDYLARHPDRAAQWGLPTLPHAETPEQGV